jgi:hypothetical protein
VHQASDLPDRHLLRSARWVVKVLVGPPGNPKRCFKRRTVVRPYETSPTFAETFTFHLDAHVTRNPATCVRLEVWDVTGRDKRVGHVEISLADVINHRHLQGTYALQGVGKGSGSGSLSLDLQYRTLIRPRPRADHPIDDLRYVAWWIWPTTLKAVLAVVALMLKIVTVLSLGGGWMWLPFAAGEALLFYLDYREREEIEGRGLEDAGS